MKHKVSLIALMGALVVASVLSAWDHSTISVGTVPTGATGSITLTISTWYEFDGIGIFLRNTTTGADEAYFYGYLGGSPATVPQYASGVSGSLSGEHADWTWYVTGLSPGNYELSYQAAWPGHPIGEDLSSYFTIGGSVEY